MRSFFALPESQLQRGKTALYLHFQQVATGKLPRGRPLTWLGFSSVENVPFVLLNHDLLFSFNSVRVNYCIKTQICVGACVCVCVCARRKESDKESEIGCVCLRARYWFGFTRTSMGFGFLILFLRSREKKSGLFTLLVEKYTPAFSRSVLLSI